MSYSRGNGWVAGARICAFGSGIVSLVCMAGCPKIDSQLVQDRAITVTEAAANYRAKKEAYLFIDARLAPDYAAKRIPGSKRLDTWDLDPKDPDPAYDAYKEIIVYGQNPGTLRAEALVKRFYHSKQNHARLMLGGLDEWISRGNPTESDPPAATQPAPAGQ